MANKFVQLMPEGRIRGAVGKLAVQVRSREPARAASVGHYVRNGLAVHGQGHSLARPHGVDHPARLVAQITYANVHVRHRSITIDCLIEGMAGVLLRCYTELNGSVSRPTTRRRVCCACRSHE